MLVLVVSLPGLVAGVVSPREATHHMERRVVISTDETWRMAAGVRDAEEAEGVARYVLPYFGGEPRVVKPPLAVWVTRLAWLGLDVEDVDALTLMMRARWGAVVMTCVLLAGTCLIGWGLGGPWAGTIAGMSVGTSLIVQRWGRIASYDVYLAGWVALGLGLWLMGMRAAQKRRGAGLSRARGKWMGMLPGVMVGAGVCLGLAWLSKGPIVWVMAAVPMVVMSLMQGKSRNGGWMSVVLLGMLVVIGVGAAVALPWYGWVLSGVADAGEAMAREFEADRESASPVWTYLGVIPLMLPWTVWLVAGLVHPWVRGDGPVAKRRGMWAAWWWLVVLVVVMSIPEAKQQRYILPVLPAAGVLIAMVVTAYDRASRRGRPEPWEGVLIGAHKAVVGVLSVLLVVGLAGWGLVYGIAVSMGVWLLAGLAVVLGLWVVLTRWRGEVRALAVVTGLWAAAALPAYWLAYLPADDGAVDPVLRTGVMADVAVTEVEGRGPIAWLDLEAEGVRRNPWDEKVMLFARRRVAVIGAEDLQGSAGDLAGQGLPGVVVAREDPAYSAVLEGAGYRLWDGVIYRNRGYGVAIWTRDP